MPTSVHHGLHGSSSPPAEFSLQPSANAGCSGMSMRMDLRSKSIGSVIVKYYKAQNFMAGPSPLHLLDGLSAQDARPFRFTHIHAIQPSQTYHPSPILFECQVHQLGTNLCLYTVGHFRTRDRISMRSHPRIGSTRGQERSRRRCWALSE
jgi:hypothetical protein